MSEQLYLSVGGVERSTPARASWSTFVTNGGTFWDFGWIPPEERSDDQNEAMAKHIAQMQPFVITGASRESEPDVNLCALWSHPTVTRVLGFAYPGTHQLTGSCVGAGGGNVAASLAYKEVIRDADPEKVILPFYPYTYGCSRKRMGDDGPGEGSLGSAWAEAAREDGILDNLSHSDLPQPKNSDALVWGKEVEMAWSAGGRKPCTDWLTAGRVHPIKTVSELKTAEDVRKALLNYYPVTEASMYGFEAREENGVLLGRRGPRWSHQMSFHAVWKHPQHGWIYYLMNQWGRGAHGKCPSGMPEGGVWILEQDVEWICRSGGEVYAFSEYNGYPAPDFVIPWIF